ncbi:MAG: phytoene desaturase family protein [Zavarzinella sp.]
MSGSRIGIIGGGLGGLASACVLAARGHQVTLFERNPWFGGKAAQLDAQGFRFDMGPTILTIPGVLERIFGEAGKNLGDYMELVRLDPQWRCFYTDGSILDLHSEMQAMANEFKRFAPEKDLLPGYQRFLQFSERMKKVSDQFFFWKSVGGMRDIFEWKTTFQTKVLGDVLAMRMGKSVADTVRKFVPEPRVAQMLDHFTQYVGSSPEASPAVLCGIATMQTNEGVWYPMLGTRAVPTALTKLAEELGVTLRNQCAVREIVTDDRSRKVTGVVTESGESISFDAVVSNCDTVRTHKEMLAATGKPSKSFQKRRGYEAACSGVVLYLGLKKKYDHILHHNFVFSNDPHTEFASIYERGDPADDLTAYVCSPAQTEPAVAPPGGDALYVLVHTPYLRPHHQWKTMFPEYRQKILNKLKTTAGMEDIEERIAFESALTPQDINDRYHVLNGAIYGLASHGKWFGAFKPANRSPDLAGLYLAGGSAHPGPGMPMALMSGWIAADVLDQDYQKAVGKPKDMQVASA